MTVFGDAQDIRKVCVHVENVRLDHHADQYMLIEKLIDFGIKLGGDDKAAKAVSELLSRPKNEVSQFLIKFMMEKKGQIFPPPQHGRTSRCGG